MEGLKHIVRSQQFRRQDLEELFFLADLMRRVVAQGGCDLLKNKIVITLFWEPSTRTRMSFEAAALWLGARGVISSENAREFSSTIKGESLEDTIRVISGYGNAVAMRHHIEGAADRAEAVNLISVLNAGDGRGQHPTQALLDVYTIQRELRKIDGLTLGMMGDLANGRTVRSLAYLLAEFAIKRIYFISPPMFRMKTDILSYLAKKGVVVEQTDDVQSVIADLDVLYQTRVQYERANWGLWLALKVLGRSAVERLVNYQRYIIDSSLVEQMKVESIIMHPLPRNREISREVDTDPRAAYFRQAWNGLFIRMALLQQVLAPEAKIEQYL